MLNNKNKIFSNKISILICESKSYKEEKYEFIIFLNTISNIKWHLFPLKYMQIYI